MQSVNGSQLLNIDVLEEILREFNFADAAIPQILRELIFEDTDIDKKRKWKKIFLYRTICRNDYEANVLVLENKIISVIIIIY